VQLIKLDINAVEYCLNINDEEDSKPFILQEADFNVTRHEHPSDIVITDDFAQKLDIACKCIKFTNKPLMLLGPSFSGKSTFLRLLAHMFGNTD